jgi:hypothetical protein
MATTSIKFKRGDDFNLDFTLTDTNSDVAVAAAQLVADEQATYDALLSEDPVDQPAIDAQLIVLDAAKAAYEASILMDITAWGIDSQVRWCGKLIDTFIVDVSQASIGLFTLQRSSEMTQLWKPREYDVDVQFTRAAGKISSETFILDVQKDITNV